MSIMETRNYQVMFHSPAFLGNAEQNGQWRAPAFKALLRQWWRVVYAAEKNYRIEIAQMREEEGRIFGAAADGKGRRSLVRLRLDRWDEGKLKSWDGLEQRKVHHPEVQKTKFKVGPQAYLGFGPLDGRGGTKLGKPNAAIQAGETAQLSIAFPDKYSKQLIQALWLMDRYGTLGGRSRNGWGSFTLRYDKESGDAAVLAVPRRDWVECLKLDWPHALGSDHRGALIWQTEKHNDWQSLMQKLAEIKIEFRTHFKFRNGRNTNVPEERHWLSYPVTNHKVKPWGQVRLPNSLRFKVRPDSAGKLVAVLFHVPCSPPKKQFQPNYTKIQSVWKKVHSCLDNSNELSRINQ